MTPDVRTAAVLLAAGDGRRVGGETNKVLLPLAGLPVFAWSVRRFARLGCVERVVLVIREQDRSVVEACLAAELPGLAVELVVGGATRHQSEWHALTALAGAVDAGEIDVVAIHDAARPLADAELFTAVVSAAHRYGGALPVRDQSHLVHRTPGLEPVRGRSVAVQTPQAFRAGPLLAAYRQAERDGFEGTDTAAGFARYRDPAGEALRIRCVRSPATNLKITFAEDVAVAERLLAAG